MIVTAEGDLDFTVAEDFNEYLSQAHTDGHHLILDLSAVTFVDSTIFAVMVDHWKKLAATGRSLVIAGASNGLSKAFWVAGLRQRVPFYPNVAEACAELAANRQARAERQIQHHGAATTPASTGRNQPA